MKGNRVLLISLLVALVGLMLVFAYIDKKEKAMLEAATPIKVVVAVKDLPQDTRLDDTVAEVRGIPKKYVQPGAVGDMEMVFDRVLSVPLLRGTQILESMFKPATVETLAKKIPTGMRAVSIAANEVSAVTGLIKPGDFVDIYLTVETGNYDPEGRVMPEEIITKLVLQNVLVLANNQLSSKEAFERQLYQDKQGAPGTVFARAQVEGESRGNRIRTLTLALSPADVQKVTLAQEIGSIAVALRSSWGEEGLEPVAPLTTKELLGIKSNIIRKSTPAWIEIRGAQQINPTLE